MFANRHEEAIEQVWVMLENHKNECIDSDTCLKSIEQILTLLNSRIEDDSEAMNQSYLDDLETKKRFKGYHHV